MKKIPIWKNIILIISVLVIIVIATLAWFYKGPRALLHSLFVDVGKASYIQISDNNGETWSEELNVEIGVNKNFKEVSGNGIKLFSPVYEVVDQPDGGYATEIVAFEEVTNNTYYYEQEFSFRSDSDYDVYLDPESIVAADPDREGYIDGAIRVAFIELGENGQETLKCIWAPNSKIEYSPNTNSFTKEGNVEAAYYYQKSGTAVDIQALEDNEAVSDVEKIPTVNPETPDEIPECGYLPAYKFMWTNGEHFPENAPSLLRFDLAEGETISTKRLKVKVWLEGYDRECVSLLNGQKFTMKFKFIADKGE